MEEGNVLGKIVKIQLIDNRCVVGTLEAVDHDGNLCIRHPYECRIIPPIKEGDKEIIDVVKMRSTVIPQGSWKSISIPNEQK
ncbi:hypothetical protein EHI8A_031830 [Entamoeba histolytica HM-1:IMSS-B]|uniref:Biotin protein ligase C-terminal domain-containing protein n=6 Tax=Entamoeba TaxID=5758 RepID=A0A175JDV1_ENTHI|nr:hypothetical protein ENU1_192740 [Entamoeba nuttalli P19]EMH77762.1 hypothetical protein EHI8A_031830 [Entamoeba histolytica HM-1:IMSS-B]EMS14683.1 hypothetical protein KM1_073030 [Entamoeba histolytica HM-3:IMSS]ENY63772.1 unknown protein, putative [Entamoeba histolytica HM-1:IMSS-A]GAT91696.1 conserved hypothetical protein [Entamoeba histolytica]EKE37559.1 hypothetical protein ENU1_192740 [Entamoeba nuttalli P19]|eukprot:XP_008860085.1 hypothetical protein ENU1_192740 [Entamoeba nuttalli P19]